MMNKKGFKVGDKVRLKDPRGWAIGGVGVVVGFDGYIRVTWSIRSGASGVSFPHLADEIEHAVRVGEQLMLFNIF